MPCRSFDQSLWIDPVGSRLRAPQGEVESAPVESAVPLDKLSERLVKRLIIIDMPGHLMHYYQN